MPSSFFIYGTLTSLILNATVQFSSAKWFRFSLIRSLFVGFIAGVLSMFSFLHVFVAHFPSIEMIEYLSVFLVALVCYSSASYVFFHFVHISEASLRVRILFELSTSPEPLNKQQLLKLYNSRELVEKRIDRLMSRGEIVEKNKKYYIKKKKIYYAAVIIDSWKRYVWEK